jgi:uncharacterized protein YfiM (DUF2279 family)
MKKIIAFLLFSCALNAGPRVADSPFTSMNGHFIKYDKAEHCAGSFMLHSGLVGIGVDNKKAMILSLSAGLAWELKDSVIPYEKYGAFGGEGFCWRDFTADAVGVFASYLVNKYVLN